MIFGGMAWGVHRIPRVQRLQRFEISHYATSYVICYLPASAYAYLCGPRH